MLAISDLHVSYGAIRAVDGLSLEVREGEIVALIGANGAGKTTALNALSGLLQPSRGTILLRGEVLAQVSPGGRVVQCRPDEIVAKGVVQVPEGRRIFANMTVWENVQLGAYVRGRGEDLTADLDRVYALFPRLRERQGQMAGTLSGGEQQMLAIGRGLMARPSLLLLDEPSLGLAPVLMKEVFAALARIRADGTTLLLVEQNAKMALALADRGYVLETGRLVLTGTGQELLNDPRVREAYLGESAGDEGIPAKE